MRTVRVEGRHVTVREGTSDVLYVQDVGDSFEQRQHFLAQAVAAGGWSLDLRGHGGSGWIRGGCYDLAGFTTDVVRVLTECLPEGVELIGQGVGGLVAACASSVSAHRVVSLTLVSGTSSGWSPDAVLCDGDLSDRPGNPNPEWLVGAGRLRWDERPDRPAGSDDPAVQLGPAVAIARYQLDEVLAGMRCPWSGPGSWLDDWLPPSLRQPQPALSSERMERA